MAVGQTAPLEQPHEAPLDRGDDRRYIASGEAQGGMKPHGAGAILRKHPVEHERVDVHVEIERRAEALDDGDSAATPIRHAVAARAAGPCADRQPRPRGTGRDPRPADNECGEADSGPIAAPRPAGTRGRPGARPARPCVPAPGDADSRCSAGRLEIYVKPFPGQERGVPVSRGGGPRPVIPF